tara:strand:+ start:347 stop:619 length:273 start_codon:yes stop_codon:yes gene_type:complete
MSPLVEFLIFVIALTATILFYAIRQLHESNYPHSNYLKSKQMKNTIATKTKTIEKEKVVAETLNGRFAMIGLIAALGAYLTTGQIIPGFV